MPLYDYRCDDCGQQFEARHSFDERVECCPSCGQPAVTRLITTAPAIMGGIMTDAGSGGKATKEQLRDKWAEETPKLRKKMVDKYGEDRVNTYLPTLNTSYESK
jgi:putative FmdB family regulatory protein